MTIGKISRLLVALLVVAIAAVAAVRLLKDDAAGSLVEAIETRGSRILGTRVDVSGAQVDWRAGKLSLADLVVANPGGFSNRDLVTIDTVELRGDLGSRVVKSLVFDGVHAVIEFRGARSNFEALGDRIADAPDASAGGQAGEGAGTAPGGDGVGEGGDEPAERRGDWTVERVEFRRIKVAVSADWTSKTVEFETGGLSVDNLSGGADDMARAAALEFLAGLLTRAAARADDDRLREVLTEKAGELRARMPKPG